jgi:sulfocyanin
MRRSIGLWILLVLCGAATSLVLPPVSTVPVAAGPHTVIVPLIAGQTPADGGFNFNGYGHGGMTIVVPVGWKVVVQFQNSSVLPHSALIAPSAAAQSSVPPATPVFAGGATKDLSTGLAQGTKATFSFTTGKPGTYAIVCGVPGHATAGMWDKLIVSATAKTPSVAPARATHLRPE